MRPLANSLNWGFGRSLILFMRFCSPEGINPGSVRLFEPNQASNCPCYRIWIFNMPVTPPPLFKCTFSLVCMCEYQCTVNDLTVALLQHDGVWGVQCPKCESLVFILQTIALQLWKRRQKPFSVYRDDIDGFGTLVVYSIGIKFDFSHLG